MSTYGAGKRELAEFSCHFRSACGTLLEELKQNEALYWLYPLDDRIVLWAMVCFSQFLRDPTSELDLARCR